MSRIRIKNITQGNLVFTAIREDGGLPLTLNAGEEKDVHPSVVTQPSLQVVMGTKVIVITGKEILVAPKPAQPAPATPPVIIMEDPTVTPETPVSDSAELAVANTVEIPAPLNTAKVRRGRR
jgi:hypothetical protein